MTLGEIEKRLSAAGVESAAAEARMLVCKFEKVPLSRLVIEKNADFTSKKLLSAVRRRERREPLQYILGEWDFMNETYEVNPSVLIPRAETEALVEFGIKNIPNGGVFCDLCTGSGCVAVSTLAARSDLSCVAVEKFSGAMETAERNAALNGVKNRARFVLGDVTEDVFENASLSDFFDDFKDDFKDCEENKDGGIKFDAILTNPPYVTQSEYEALEPELYFEPKAALTDGGDGLSIIKSILEIYPKYLKNGGFIAIETGAYQKRDVEKIASGVAAECEYLKDVEGRDRVCVCRFPANEK